MKELFEKQDKEFEEKFPETLYVEAYGDFEHFDVVALQEHISKIRQEAYNLGCEQATKKTLEAIREEIEKKRKYHKEFECNGAHNGKGCYETFCEDQECRNAPKEYNQALDDLLKALS